MVTTWLTACACLPLLFLHALIGTAQTPTTGQTAVTISFGILATSECHARSLEHEYASVLEQLVLEKGDSDSANVANAAGCLAYLLCAGNARHRLQRVAARDEPSRNYPARQAQVKHGTSKQVQRMRFMCRIRLLPALSCTQCFAASALRPNSLHVASVQPGMGRGHLLYQSALQITDVCPIEKGCYVCRAANMLGTRDSPPALLSVHMAICAMGLHGVFSSKKKKTFSSHVATQRWPSIRTADQDLVTYGRKHKKSVEIAAK
ncbi:uncharacterized protein [Dermacentor albipictus]|uniref:uncharacterized protein isoform X6 n=1 Tax=Dermacentor albipictus TaxID=60249 RepID=UPI0031FE220E